jgi:hypothetical protein
MRLEETVVLAACGGLIVIAATRLQSLPPWPDERVRRIAAAIAIAEGYWVPGSIPNLRNNPGDLTDPNTGQIRTFASADEGWKALYRHIERILAGESSIYPADGTIRQIARIYTATEQDAWAQNVARALGVSPDTKLRDA